MNSSSTTDLKVAFLGTGSMNGAILRGLLASGFDPDRVIATCRSEESANALRNQAPVTVVASETDGQANAKAVKGAGVVVLGVKPKGIQALAAEISQALEKDAIVVSVAAAVTTGMIEAQLRAGQPVVRAMPNTPSQVGMGVTSISAGRGTGPADMKRVADLLKSTGFVTQVPEDQVNAVAAVSGSGPAYAFYLAEIMAAAGQQLGLDADLARVLAAKTVAGAGKMLDAPEVDPVALRKAVTSPNGTTEAAIRVFDDADMRGIMARAAQAASERAEEITRELGGA